MIKRILVIGCIVFVLMFAVAIYQTIRRFSNQFPPTITYGEFPFRFVYELDGVIYEVEDAVICEFRNMGSYITYRTWNNSLKSGAGQIIILSDENANSVLKPERVNDTSAVFLDYGMSAYYMGDPNNKENPHRKPHVCYYENYHKGGAEYRDSTPLTEEQLEKHFGIKIIEFEFSEPIKNTFEEK